MSQISNNAQAVLFGIKKIVPDLGDDVTPGLLGEINLAGGNNITTTGNDATDTVTIDLTGTTNHAVQVGNAGGSLTSLPLALTGQGMMGSTGADPIWTGSPSFSGLVTAGTGFTATTGNVTITAGNITLPSTNTAGTEGLYILGGTEYISNYGTNNTFLGGSGNRTLTVATATNNTSVGRGALALITTGTYNVALGSGSMVANTTGSRNIAAGDGSLASNISGNYNVALGDDALNASTTAINCIAIGTNALRNVTIPASGGQNIAIGSQVLQSITTSENNLGLGTGTLNSLVSAGGNVEGGQNTILGFRSAPDMERGNYNTGLGYETFRSNQFAAVTGICSKNIAIGALSGYYWADAESNNIALGSAGRLAEINTIRIGNTADTVNLGSYTFPQQTKCYIAGIRGITPDTADASMVIIDSLGQLGTLAAATNGQIAIGSTGANMILGTISSTGGTTIITNGAGTINIEVSPGLATATGFATWGGAGNYFDDTTLGDFTVLRPGTGYINGKLISWAAPQTVSGLTAGNTYIIYIDAAGTIQKSTAFTESLIQNNILLFECLRDSTPVTNNQITVKENHPYSYQPSVSYWAHEIIGTVIENNNNGANITLNGTVKIQINGADELSDHGLYTTIPDSAAAAVTFRKMYTTAGGKWATQNNTDTFGGFYNSAGTPTALTAGRFAVYTLYCSKDTITSALPFYFAVLHTAQFTSLVAANTAISNGTIAKATNELAYLEVCQLGYVVFSQNSGTIVQVTISKSTLKQTLSTGGTNTAALVNTVTTNFNNILSSADTNVQAALETIDDWSSWITATANVSPMVADRGYITKHATPATMVTYTLPTTSTVGRRYRVVGYTAGGFRIAQNANQQILFGASATTIGVGGYIESTDNGDAVELVCVTVDNEYRVCSCIGNITIV